jgi:flagellar assembly factor FliW
VNINTKFFGEINIEDECIINFPEGIPGFEQFKSYIILDIENNTNMRCLQSIDNSSICLVIINPWDVCSNYEFELTDTEINQLSIKNESDINVYNVITIRGDKVTVNLVAPIVINIINNIGKQIILSNTEYSIRQEISC